MSRKFATFITLAVIFILGNVPSVLSDGPWRDVRVFGMTVFDAFDYISANIFFILTSFLSCIFIGFVLKKSVMTDEITNMGTVNQKLATPLFYYIKFFIPVLIAIIAVVNFM